MAEKRLEDFILRLHPDDNVAVVKRPLKVGTHFENGLTAKRDIPPGHKIAIADVPEGEAVRKYGQIIGFAKTPIRPGDHVHTQNVAMKDFGRDYQFCVDARPVEYRKDVRTF